MTDNSGQGLRALAKRLGLDPDRAIAFLSASAAQSPEDDAFDSADSIDAQEFEPARKGPDGVPLFPSREAAEQAADIADLDGVHEMDVDGETMFAPGDSHEAAIERFGDGEAADQGDDDDDKPDDYDGKGASASMSLEAEATGVIDVGDVPDDDSIDLEAAEGSLSGIVWGAGDHDLALGGEPTPVRVPPDTVPATFERLKDDLQAGEVTIGFDHPAPDSVAAQTGIVDIGQATGAALSADERFIVLTDSELTNQQAAEAAEAGDFDGLDWSVVADVAVRRDDDGQPVREDGRIVLDATRIRRIDAVDEGAVDQASIERSQAALPDLKDEVQTVQDAAEAGLNQTDTQTVVTALKASATAFDEINHMTDFDPDVDDDVPEAARKQLSAAADIIDEQEQELEAAQDRADAFEGVLQAHDVDPDEFDDPQAAAQALIDEQTEQTRREIAELEANLAAFDTDEGDVDDRVDALAGSAPADLQNTLNARKAKAFEVQQEQQNRGVAAARSDQTGESSFAGGSNGDADQDADDLALSAMDGGDRIEAQARGQSPAEYLADEYDVQASQYDAGDDVLAAIMEAEAGSN